MKKVVSLLLTLVLMVGLLSTAVFAEEKEQSDVIRFEQVLTKRSDKGLFTLTSTYADGDGWYCDDSDTLTITAAKGLTITRIEAEISYQYYYYGEVGVSGNAFKENYPMKNGDTVTVSRINSSEFSFVGGNYYVQFKNITVYYTCTHSFDENGICEFCHYVDESKHEHHFDDNRNCACGKTKCDVGEHVLENGICEFCHYVDESKHKHIFDDNNNCACGKTKCDVEGHSYVTICQVCGAEAPENPVVDTPLIQVEDAEKGMSHEEGLGSTLSQGNLAIVCSVAGLAVGMAVMFFIMKKKPAAANGANREAEE